MATITFTQTIKHRMTLKTVRAGNGSDVNYDLDAQQDFDWELASFSNGIDLVKFTYRVLHDERNGEAWLIELPKRVLGLPTQEASKKLLRDYAELGDLALAEWRGKYNARTLKLKEMPLEFHGRSKPVLDRDRIFLRVFFITGQVVVAYSTQTHKRFAKATLAETSDAQA